MIPSETEIEELYYRPWSFRRVRGSGFATGFNNESKYQVFGRLIIYLDGEVIFREMNGKRHVLREKREKKKFDNLEALT